MVSLISSSSTRLSIVKLFLLISTLSYFVQHNSITNATPIITKSRSLSGSSSNIFSALTRGFFDSDPSPSPSPSPLANEAITMSPSPEEATTTPMYEEPMLTPTPAAMTESTPLVAEPTPVTNVDIGPTSTPENTQVIGDGNGNTNEDESSNTENPSDDPDQKSAGTTSVATGGISLISVAVIAIAILVPGLLIYTAIRRRRSSDSAQGFVNMPPAQQPNTYSGERRSTFTVGDA